MKLDHLFEQIHRLATAQQEGLLDAAGMAELETLLRDHPEARHLYLKHAHDSAALHLHAHGSASDAAVEAGRRSLWRWAVAAMIIGMISIWGWIGLPSRSSSGPNLTAAPGVALLSRTVDVLWQHEPMLVDRTLPAGSRLELKAGLVQVEFFSGATVVIEGPADLELVASDQVICHRGRVRANVPPAAQGFTVRTPRGRVVDLGTEFGLSVGADGDSEVHVFDGKVRLEHADAPKELMTGGAVRLFKHGMETIANMPDVFAGPAVLAQRTDAGQASRVARWEAHRQRVLADPSLIFAYDFEGGESWARRLINRSSAGSALDGAIVGATLGRRARWPGKGAAQIQALVIVCGCVCLELMTPSRLRPGCDSMDLIAGSVRCC